MRRCFLAVLALLASGLVHADVQVKICSIVLSPGATEEEQHAAAELRDYLGQIVGKPIPLIANAKEVPLNGIVVGAGSLARQLVPNAPWSSLASEQTLVRSAGDRMVVAGGAPRGTLYAVYRLLQEKAGVRWWAPWATDVPKNPNLRFGAMEWSERPAFEYRDPYWFHAFDADWAARNFNNGFNTRVDAARGGKTQYEGFVHTYFGLVPPEKYFGPHPEWFSEIDGYRRWQDAQLCTTNPQLRDFVVEQVRQRLRANPKATIVSVSQNDCYNPCRCAVCRALSEREGSDAALVLDLANYVGDHIRDEFPKVAVDTLAYQWSRHPTRTMKPRPNVTLRLCSIECNFAEPLYAPANQAFADDIRGWNRLTQRLYIWDYCTNFAHYLHPQPDYFSLGKSIKWFADNGVKGVFEEGAYQSMGADMAELKAWVTAQLLWNPKLDSEKLVDEFLVGYYGPAAPPIREYLYLMANAAKGTHVSFNLGASPPFLGYETMSQAQRLWAEAKRRAGTAGAVYMARVNMSALSPELVWITHWRGFRYAAAKAGDRWPMAESRQAAIDRWLATSKGSPYLPGYTSINALDEGMQSPERYFASLGPEPTINLDPLPVRVKNPAAPRGLAAGIDYQDDLANLWNVPDGSELRADASASDGIACWMPGSHYEWAFQMPLSKRPAQGRFKVYVVVRVDRQRTDESRAFSAGVYDSRASKDLTTHIFTLQQAGTNYAAYELGTFDVHDGLTVWVAPPANANVSGVWVDRIYLVPAS